MKSKFALDFVIKLLFVYKTKSRTETTAGQTVILERKASLEKKLHCVKKIKSYVHNTHRYIKNIRKIGTNDVILIINQI